MTAAADVLASCAGKVAFESWDLATATLKRRRMRDRFKDEVQQVYRCRCCRHWHIGTTIRKRPQPKRQRDFLDDSREWPWRAHTMQPVHALSNGEAASNGFIPASKETLSKETLVAPATMKPSSSLMDQILWTPIALGTHRCEVAIVYVTPAMAKEFLENKAKNRKVRTANRDFLSRQVKTAWAFTGQPLIFDMEGKLQDGQHRCTACVMSGKAFITLAVKGIASDAFDRMDIGAKRTAGDILGIEGGSPNAVLAGASVPHLVNYREHQNWWDKKGHLSPHDVREEARKFAGLDDALRLGEKIGRALGQPTRLWVAAVWCMCQIDKVTGAEFAGRLISGIGLEAGDPELSLRNRMLEFRSRGFTLSRRVFAGLVARSWNARRQNRKLTKLYSIADGEDVPPFA